MVFFHRIDNSSPFTTSYRCYPVSFLADNFRSSVEKGGKIIMPPSALDVLIPNAVDFAPPVGYQPTDSGSSSEQSDKDLHKIEDHIEIPSVVQGFQAFSGTGYRLDGKNKQDKTEETDNGQSLGQLKERERGVPNYNYRPGSLTFFRNLKQITAEPPSG
ncbi:unnamed protein product [Schistosoma mattheei]|uniref:Ubiquitin fusion degradation protein UFD1 N-terminal subdomain 1 domain-containing protein n=1 Tax=Schistosoma mattheei TaxID=31246 RepID=A0AA85B9T3_9TREM|nr:unnamed protein product [Schistosoma mattheei]